MALISECVWPLSHHLLHLTPMKLILQQTVLYPPPLAQGSGPGMGTPWAGPF